MPTRKGRLSEVRQGISIVPTVEEVFFPKILFIYLLMRDTQRDRETERYRQREKQAPCKEPYVGLDPRSPG